MRIVCREDGKKIRILCNSCGKEIRHLEGEKKQVEDYISVDKTWGYFSNKDGETHHLDLCETCYDRWIHMFQIPVEIRQETELL